MFVGEHCKNIKQNLVYELGFGPSVYYWTGRVVSIDKAHREADRIGWFQNMVFDERCDLFSMVWSIAYSQDPMDVLSKAIDLIKTDGHLLVITRLAAHKKDEGYFGTAPLLWMPTLPFMSQMTDYVPGISLVASEVTDDGEFYAGLWRKT